MLQARFQVFNNYMPRIHLVVMVILCFCIQARAQPGLNQPMRVLEYTNKVIRGVAPAGSEIRLYYATAGNPCITAVAAVPFKVIQAVAPNFWYYSTDFDLINEFAAPVVVSYIKPGTTTEVFESNILTKEEFMISPNDCSGRGTIRMFPALTDPSAITWQNQRGEMVGNGIEIANMPAGTYTMRYTNRHGCSYKSEPLTIGEAAPIAQEVNISLNCNESSRTIQGQYIGTGVEFIWERQDDGLVLSNDRNVTLAPGKYYFSVKNISGCWSQKANVIIISSLSTAYIDASGKAIKDASCGQKDGAIEAIKVISGEDEPVSYKWFNSEHELVGNTLDMHNLAPDTYTLEAYTPGSTCPVVLSNIEVGELNAITFSSVNYTPVQASCGGNNGAIKGIVTNATRFRWIKIGTPDVEVSDQLDLVDASPGYYVLELRNDVNCVYRSREFHIQETSPAIQLITAPVIKNDECTLSSGSITGARFNTSIKTYTWLDQSGNVVGNAADLTKIKAGNYTLLVKSDRCEASYNYSVTNETESIAAPVMEDIVVCAPSDVMVSFNETADIYRIYNADGVLLDQRNDKNFRVSVDKPGTYYAALAKGTCESTRSSFSISFGSSGLTIPSAFSPNGDGNNDKWIIKGIDAYLDPEVKVFNREGTIVFHTRGRSAPFDGKRNGEDLPVGVYYYMVRASEVCPSRSGSLTIIR